jgi:hypothetical protein
MLVEDQADFRHLIATLLGRQADLEVVAQLDRSQRPAGMPLWWSSTWRCWT